jgi:hypothetical protein
MKNSDITPSSLLSECGRPFVLWIGALTPLKGPLDVIDIARALPAVDFVMIGYPYDRSILDRLLKEKTSNLHYLGCVSDRVKNDLIRWSSAGITTSKYEGFGWVPFEFLTANKPVLAYPLPVFREIYGHLIIYVDDVHAFVDQIRHLSRQAFKTKVEPGQIERLQTRWNLKSAASRIMNILNLTSLVIFSRDRPADSEMIAGADLVNWKLWRSMTDIGVEVQIFANGAKYTKQFDLASRTTQVCRQLTFVKKLRDASDKRMDPVNRGVLKVLDFALRLLEPACYVFSYLRKNRVASRYVLVDGESTVFAGLFVKLVFGSKLLCLIHDARFISYDYFTSSFPMKVYYRLFAHGLRYVDKIIVVSRTVLNELSRIGLGRDKIVLIWGD